MAEGVGKNKKTDMVGRPILLECRQEFKETPLLNRRSLSIRTDG